ncbi:1-acylglycerol-3-phosphate O-acyltransferase [Halobacteriovorax sp. JY17]|uniref:1-acylglycerol-3-phosphate O-acyltransferase n=1 Tax=Halobacteriovorax sp. JY17 TaxID=2014617 RepID=UPI000C60713E|nr:1-acylglycerol-3-phosphate O-acyltransferase [Halobacteriovorax sp. JY17]PIK15684.1 MAG: 1-acyl-sn-glycerol-3-phosphate acyltransferase [Halobacteriovorax sp. JY17]
MILKTVRFILALILLALVGIVGTIVSALRPFNPNNVYIMARMVRLGTTILGIEVVKRNVDKLQDNRPGLFISNHQHNIDVFIACHILPDRTVSLGKKSLRWIPLFGQFYWLSGNVLIDRKNKRSAHGTMDQVGAAIREKNTSIWMMPEGTRSHGRGVLPFKKGAFFTAINAQVPISPICISSYDVGLDFSKWKSGKVIVEVLDAIPTEGLTKKDVGTLCENTYQLMKKKVQELDNELS